MEFVRKTNVLIKTVRRFVVQPTDSPPLIRCEQCRELMLTTQIAADSFGVSTRRIYLLIESEAVHFVETEINEIYVCPLSLKRVFELIQ